MSALHNYFAQEFAPDEVGDWLDVEIVPPWETTGEYPTAVRWEHGAIRLRAFVYGGEPGTVALRLPLSMRPEKDMMRCVDSYAEGPCLMVQGYQVLAGGYVKVWPPVDAGANPYWGEQ